MNASSNPEDWRHKYLDSLRSLESEEQRFRVMEVTLKRLAGRLCIASLGQSPQLDIVIRKLQTMLRNDVSGADLEQMTPALTEAIHALDHSADASPIVAASPAASAKPASVSLPPASIVADERVRSILSALSSELKRDPQLVSQVDALDAKLTASLTSEQLPEVLSSLTEMIGKRIQRIEQAKREVEVLLSQMVGKLDELGQFVADQNQNQQQSLASSETLNTTLVGEMKAMGESVESAHDLQQIRLQVRSRLDLIGQHLQEFRQREATRAQAIQSRNELMRARVVELEAEAGRLHNQLKDEQRLALLDVLTQVPNRQAYDRRIEEELQRWQRFSQPTCIAAWDIDRFKLINDTYGHRAGDRVLLTVAKCLAARVRATDFVARYGGEEFVMIFSGTALTDALRLSNEIREAVGKLVFHFNRKPVSVTISCGITALIAGDTSDAAFDRADKALYRAKGQGRNCSVAG